MDRGLRAVALLAGIGLTFGGRLDAQPPIAGRLVTVEGTVSVVGPAMPAEYLRVVLNPLGSGGGPSAEVRQDGTFTIGSVVPGHWRLSVMPGVFIKSITRGNGEISAADIEIGSQMGPPLKIVVGTDFAVLRVRSRPPSAEGIFVVYWNDADPDVPMFPVTPDHSLMLSRGEGISMVPGRYLVCAFAGFQPWMTMTPSAPGRVLRGALERHCRKVAASEGGVTTVEAVPAPVISAEELKGGRFAKR